MTKRNAPCIGVMDGVTFSPFVVNSGNITVQGGFNKRRREELPVKSLEFYIEEQGRRIRFFHLAKTEGWFGKVISGNLTLGRGCKYIELLDLIRSKLKEHFDSTAPAASSAIPDEEDPLASVSALAENAANARVKAKARAKPKANGRPNLPLNRPVLLNMPNVPACVDSNCSEVVQVLAMLRGPTGRNIWLDLGSLHWACTYAAI